MRRETGNCWNIFPVIAAAANRPDIKTVMTASLRKIKKTARSFGTNMARNAASAWKLRPHPFKTISPENPSKRSGRKLTKPIKRATPNRPLPPICKPRGREPAAPAHPGCSSIPAEYPFFFLCERWTKSSRARGVEDESEMESVDL